MVARYTTRSNSCFECIYLRNFFPIFVLKYGNCTAFCRETRHESQLNSSLNIFKPIAMLRKRPILIWFDSVSVLIRIDFSLFLHNWFCVVVLKRTVFIFKLCCSCIWINFSNCWKVSSWHTDNCVLRNNSSGFCLAVLNTILWQKLA